MRWLGVLLSREEILPDRLAGATVVVVDVFLATTTLLTILENGAPKISPAASLKETDTVSDRLDRSTRLRDDEQDSDGSEGYDLGPFPEEYPPAAVAGKDVVFVTTNGTQTIANAAPAERALLGCLRNTPAVARCSQALETDPIYPICADGRFALDDFFGAATILSCINAQGWRLNDAAWMALDFMERHRNVAEIPRLGRMGRWFTWRRMETFVFVAAVGASDLVPEAKEGQILVADQAASDGPRELTS